MQLDDSALKLLFLEARTHKGWQPQDVPDSLLRQLVDLMKMGPTASNCLPARVVFVRSKAAKERLMPHLSDGNVDKTMEAPASAIIGHDLTFFEHPPKGQDKLSGFEAIPSALRLSRCATPPCRAPISSWRPARWASTRGPCRASTTPAWIRSSSPARTSNRTFCAIWDTAIRLRCARAVRGSASRRWRRSFRAVASPVHGWSTA